jgi:hypothetical protein
MYSPVTLLASLIFLLAPFSSAICNSGEVGIGTNQLCQIVYEGTTCTGALGTIYANNCNYIDVSWNAGFCSGGWDSGYGVSCSNGVPETVTTTGGDFGNCYVPSDQDCSAGPEQYDFVDYCCQRL